MVTYASAPLQKVWGWKIAAYLFGAGMGAGAYVLGSAVLLYNLAPAAAGIFGMVLGLVLVGLSVPFLILDLERPAMFLRVLVRARRSWVSRGAWILMLFSAWAVLTLAAGVWPGSLMQSGSAVWVLLLAVGLVGGILVGAYTGLLIGTLLARPLWNTPAIPALFLVSALSTGIAATVLVGSMLGGAGMHESIAAYSAWVRPLHLGLLVGEVLLIYFHLNICYGRVRYGVLTLTKGALSRPFWGLVIIAGLVLPFLLEVIAPFGGGLAAELLAHTGVVVGGFTLRRIILAAGTRAEIESLGAAFAIRPEY